MRDFKRDPALDYGGTWERLQDRYIFAANGDNYFVSNNTGTRTVGHALTESEMPSHGHGWLGVNDGAGTSQQWGNYPFRIYQDITTNWGGSAGCIQPTGGNQAHSHDIPRYALFVYRRTA